MRRTARRTAGRAAVIAAAAGLLLPACTGVAHADHRDHGDRGDDVPRRAEKVARQVLGERDGWAAAEGGTTGGSAASSDNVHVVDDKAGLIEALGGEMDNRGNDTPAIVFVDGTIDANTDAQGRPLTCDDYADPEYSLDAYLDAYDPAAWGARDPEGPLEEARERSVDNQKESIQVWPGSNVTIIGLGDDARILGMHLLVQDVDNVILRNLAFEDASDCFPGWDPGDGGDGNWNSEYDNVSVRGATHVWIDHNEFDDGDNPDSGNPEYFGREYQVHDGLLDITHGADLVTVSHSRFADHDKTMLIGSTDSPTYDVGKLRVTLHHNRFDNVLQRAPRVRYGQVHVYNNHYVIPEAGPGEKEYSYSWGVGVESMIYAENNYFDIAEGIAPSRVIRDWRGEDIHETGSMVNGRSRHDRVDLLAEYNEANDPDLGSDVGWEPSHTERVGPTQSVPAKAGGGVGRIL
ncbi:pectate lyase [Spinactinospora alkalitolerans]|uniref:Pectate lyase n=1 Tax=Spinactinospora alkalitolerans TaxID=687207 RepID=A0A852TS35_9ACTN|nr:pectate lyase [Spinactinospora alkalitolerans]NYE47196.1 pectate lyase [Spinactinospora alkalitolerans]